MTRQRKIKDRKGFTLLEIMVVVGLLTFIMSAIFGILASARRVWATGEALITLQQEGRLGLDRMVRELRLSSSKLTNVLDNRTIRFNIPIDADGDGFIDVDAVRSVVYGADDPGDSNANGQLWEAGWHIQYQIDLANRQVIRRVLDTNENLVTQRILVKYINPDPSFTYFCVPNFQTGICGVGIALDGAVNIGLAIQIDRMEGLTLSPPLEIALETQVRLRN